MRSSRFSSSSSGRAGASRSAPSRGTRRRPSRSRCRRTVSSSAATCLRSGPRWPASTGTEAGVAGKIDLRIAPATETLDQLLANGEEDAFDFAFIDADKVGYDDYYERLLRLVRPGGLIAVDNTLWHGAVLDADSEDEDTRAIQAFNAKLAGDSRITLCLLPVADGVTLARRR